ncbi:MAG TPA: type II toxin-antitoxin system RelE/ParE family toxin [Polyangiaceae bacterium]|jgi:mRNA interferase RelE/StbE
MPYEVRFKPSAAKELAKLPAEVRRRIAPRIDALATTPRPPGAEKLVGEEAWRIRVGDHRVVYTIEDRVLVVLVVHIGNRREIYKRLRR